MSIEQRATLTFLTGKTLAYASLCLIFLTHPGLCQPAPVCTLVDPQTNKTVTHSCPPGPYEQVCSTCTIIATQTSGLESFECICTNSQVKVNLNLQNCGNNLSNLPLINLCISAVPSLTCGPCPSTSGKAKNSTK